MPSACLAGRGFQKPPSCSFWVLTGLRAHGSPSPSIALGTPSRHRRGGIGCEWHPPLPHLPGLGNGSLSGLSQVPLFCPRRVWGHTGVLLRQLSASPLNRGFPLNQQSLKSYVGQASPVPLTLRAFYRCLEQALLLTRLLSQLKPRPSSCV